ncbi:MAG: hypothetical protein GWN94_14245, partial [Phycisphaerae bacterium]|nr:hypothetical protein [Phycisphaerae bacterium]NIS52251.1 hypothetical protein [Phycisphaerae bacterium]NIW93926.1 hypothetical protein [Phycisphaerae bacterium]NIW99550.1 hypothetical protein [Phycisphaerae bacterium]
DLKTIQKRWRTDTTIDLDEARQRELARIDQLEREYWQAWEKSKQPRKRVSQTDKTVSRQTEERTGDPRYLAGVQWCIQQRCKLLDIEAPQRQQVQLEDEHGVFKTLLSVLHRKDDEGETG